MKKHVLVHATASCDSTSKLGRFFATLTYNNQSKYVTGDLANTTADKCIITGVIEAVNLVREACNLSISIPTKLAFDDFGYPSGSNIQLKTCFVNPIAEKNAPMQLRNGRRAVQAYVLKLIELLIKQRGLNLHY